MSLRSRLQLIILILLFVGMVGAALGTFAVVRDNLVQQSDRQLDSVGEEIARLLATRPGHGTLPLPAEDTAAGRLWRSTMRDGGSPSYIQIRDGAGTAVQTYAPAGAPDLDPLPQPEPAAATNPDGSRTIRVDDVAGHEDWRIRISRLPGDGTLIIGLRTGQTDTITRQLAGAMILITGVVLVAVAVLAWRAIRLGTRPLETITATAAAIADGDLSRRVAARGTGTEVGRLATAFNAMLDRLGRTLHDQQEAEDRLRRFVADASHELRSPVANIRGYAELFRRGAELRPADLATSMERIESEAARMGLLVDDLLLLARLDSEEPRPRHEPVDLAKLAADAVADARALEPDRHLTLRVDGPVVVSGDANQLRQILANLITNVRHHTPAGAPATVRVGADGDQATIEITDTGPGLDPEEYERVFERFYRSPNARKDRRTGAGLGLSIVATIAAAHCGRADAVPGPDGSGTTFRITLPTH